jgi:hypothetical protein
MILIGGIVCVAAVMILCNPFKPTMSYGPAAAPIYKAGDCVTPASGFYSHCIGTVKDYWRPKGRILYKLLGYCSGTRMEFIEDEVNLKPCGEENEKT